MKWKVLKNHVIDQNSRFKKSTKLTKYKIKKMQNDKSVEFTTCRIEKVHKEQNSKIDSCKIGKHRIDKVQNQWKQN